MAAILRFGAEDLFGQEDEVAGAAVVEEDLDAILARAEVSEGEGRGGGVCVVVLASE